MATQSVRVGISSDATGMQNAAPAAAAAAAVAAVQRAPQNAATAYKIHGTVFGTLAMMSLMPAELRHSLVPFGWLAARGIPCYAGANDKGSMYMNGTNRYGTSWTDLQHFEKIVEDYTGERVSIGNIEGTEKRLEKHIGYYTEWHQALKQMKEEGEQYEKEVEKLEKDRGEKLQDEERSEIGKRIFKTKYFCLPFQLDDVHNWNGKILAIRRLRSFDPDVYEKKYGRVIKDLFQEFAAKVEKSLADRQRTYEGFFHLDPDGGKARAAKILSEESEPIRQTYLLDLMTKFCAELEAPPPFVVPPADREKVLDATPIVFLTTELAKEDRVHYRQCGDHGQEYCVERMMKLGEQITVIATTAAGMAKVESHLKEQGLAGRVRVITLDDVRSQRL